MAAREITVHSVHDAAVSVTAARHQDYVLVDVVRQAPEGEAGRRLVTHSTVVLTVADFQSIAEHLGIEPGKGQS